MLAHSPTGMFFVTSAIAKWGMIFNVMQAPPLKQHARNKTSDSNKSEERDKIMQYVQMVRALVKQADAGSTERLRPAMMHARQMLQR